MCLSTLHLSLALHPTPLIWATVIPLHAIACKQFLSFSFFSGRRIICAFIRYVSNLVPKFLSSDSVRIPADLSFLSRPQFWFLSPQLSGATVLCSSSRLLCCSWKWSVGRELGQWWDSLRVSLYVTGLYCLYSVPADNSLIYFVQVIVAAGVRASYSVLAGSWNPPRV